MSRYYWLVYLDRCIGCETCVIACKQENGTISGVHYRRLHHINPEQFPGQPTLRISVSCNHCEKPACLAGCPAKAYTQVDGIVLHHPEVCIGCQYCIWVCPYDAPQYAQAKGKVEKCNLCIHRLTRGLEPACVAACPTGALQLVETEPGFTNTNQPVSIGSETPWRITVPGFPEGRTCPKLRLKHRRRSTDKRRDSR